jgi:peroxiredoxin Q/BCP
MDKGALAPHFALLDDQGEERTLSGFLTSGPVVLFFYPAGRLCPPAATRSR